MLVGARSAATQEHVIGSPRQLVELQTAAFGKTRLGIEIDQKRSPPALGQCRTERAGRCRLARATLLIRDRDDSPHEATSAAMYGWICTVIRTSKCDVTYLSVCARGQHYRCAICRRQPRRPLSSGGVLRAREDPFVLGAELSSQRRIVDREHVLVVALVGVG
jgi:hypothetical protein